MNDQHLSKSLNFNRMIQEDCVDLGCSEMSADEAFEECERHELSELFSRGYKIKRLTLWQRFCLWLAFGDKSWI